MRKHSMISAALMVMLGSSSLFARGPAAAPLAELGEPQAVLQAPGQPVAPELPAPAAQPVPLATPPLPEGAMPGPSLGDPPRGELFPKVAYRWVRKIAPCSVPMVVSVKDPCASKDACCPAKCVNVEICVPKCPEPPKVITNKSGCKTCYDFGKYRVEVVSRGGAVVVSYHN